MSEKKFQPTVFHNWLSLGAAIFSAVLFAAIVAMIILDFMVHAPNPYLGIVTYLILPGFLTAGLSLVILGAVLERRRRRKAYPEAVKPYPVFDLNNAVHQRAFSIATVVGTVFLIFSAFGSYKAFHFTESVTFCGATCHQVMEPEFTAYKHSPHARVACVQCHIGPGADWYVKSKLSGAYQVYSVIFHKYSSPIKTPIKNLRPAQETCEQCHWPQQFFGAVENDHRYFLSDEQNSPWHTRMLVLVGGGERTADDRKGIHWHMNIANKINYIATDEKRQVIPWVKKTEQDGTETVYVDEGSKFSADHPPEGELRRMDCMDCHNRPSHHFRSPRYSVNDALARGDIARDLPFIKREAVAALSKKYDSKGDALKTIRAHLSEFYAKKYPQVSTGKSRELERAISTVEEIYKVNFFPRMGVSWEVYPENIGHLTAPGCFRCHDGKHKSADGKVINNACKSCHIIIEQGTPGASETSVDGLEFRHPDPSAEGMWQDMACTDCHTGGPM